MKKIILISGICGICKKVAVSALFLLKIIDFS
jgi:hypothetical protein